jgi:formate dehydrogenase major subunit
VPSLSTSFGRGAATTFQEDLQFSDCILIMGSNMAEAHPVGFRFPMKARERGAKIIHVDPHYSRTSASATTYVPIRAGSDIAFLGGIINQILIQERWFKEYVLHYTNAATVIADGYVDAEQDASGIFSGYEPENRAYNMHNSNWHYANEPSPPPTSTPKHIGALSRSETLAQLRNGQPERDLSLQNPNCVLNILRRHYARYTPEMVSEICGCSPQQLLEVAEQMMQNSGRERTGSVVYAVGWTQHTTGVEMIRTAAIMQLLLGNIGRHGGGIMAMRGHASIQGSTDIPTLYNMLPGYIPQPARSRDHDNLEGYFEQEKVDHGVWSSFRSYVISLLKAWYGEAATPQNEWGFPWIPRLTEDHSQLPFAIDMAAGKVRGYFLIGQNPAAGAPNAGLNRAALKQLDWLVVRDFFMIESATFWKDGPDRPDPRQIKTEVFFLPAATGVEKGGTLTNTERLLQWHEQAIDPPDDCRSDLWFMWNLGRRLKQLYADSTRDIDQGLLNLTWDYAYDEPHRLPDGRLSSIKNDPDPEKILREINGFEIATGKQIKQYQELKDDGSTACGCWIYAGVFPEKGRNRAKDRVGEREKHVHPNWAWAWPGNRRMMYNRASADPEGKPWSERKKYVWWDEEKGEWTGLDTPDFEPNKRPDYRPSQDSKGMASIAGDAPFILKPDGQGWLYAPGGTKDGTLPTHYEPFESPFAQNLLYRQRDNPTAMRYDTPLNELATPGDPKYPLVATSYRLTEHYLSGPMSRFDSWLNELQPGMFVEISPELAREHGISHGDWVVLSSPRGSIESRAMVTPRMQPLRVDGRVIHQVGFPIHFGWAGEVAGGMANDLTSIVTDVNVSIHEAKAFVCNIRRGRLQTPGLRPSEPVAVRPEPLPVAGTGSQAQPEGKSA